MLRTHLIALDVSQPRAPVSLHQSVLLSQSNPNGDLKIAENPFQSAVFSPNGRDCLPWRRQAAFGIGSRFPINLHREIHQRLSCSRKNCLKRFTGTSIAVGSMVCPFSCAPRANFRSRVAPSEIG